MRRVRQAALLGLVALVLAAAVPAGAEVWVYTDDRGNAHFSDWPRHAGYRRVALPDPRHAPVNHRQYDGIIARAAEQNGLDPGLVKAVVHVESNFQRRAVSRKGARGLMQLMPGTARALGVDDPFDPWQNIYGGTRYLGRLLQHFSGDLPLALAAYNAGADAVHRHDGIPPYRETQGYVKRVLKLYRRYDAEFR